MITITVCTRDSLAHSGQIYTFEVKYELCHTWVINTNAWHDINARVMSHVCLWHVTHGNLPTECCATTERLIRSKAMPTGCEHAKASSNHRSSVPNSHSRCVRVLWERRCVRETVHTACPTCYSLLQACCSLVAVWQLFCQHHSLLSRKSNVIFKGTRRQMKFFFARTTSEFCFQVRAHATCEFCLEAKAPTPNFAQDSANCCLLLQICFLVPTNLCVFVHKSEQTYCCMPQS